jgi:hypothetical protein
VSLPEGSASEVQRAWQALFNSFNGLGLSTLSFGAMAMNLQDSTAKDM